MKAARAKRTIYLMKLSWLKDSLSHNNRKPLNEVDRKYTWELEHAKKVQQKRKEKQQATRKELAEAKRIAAKEEGEVKMGNRCRAELDAAADCVCEHEGGHSEVCQRCQVAGNPSRSDGQRASTSGGTSKPKVQDIIDSGKFTDLQDLVERAMAKSLSILSLRRHSRYPVRQGCP